MLSHVQRNIQNEIIIKIKAPIDFWKSIICKLLLKFLYFCIYLFIFSVWSVFANLMP